MTELRRWQHDVSKRKRSMCTEAGLKERCVTIQQRFGSSKRSVETIGIRINDDAFWTWVIERLRNRTYAVTGGVVCNRLHAIFAKLWTVKFQPQSLWTLAMSDEL